MDSKLETECVQEHEGLAWGKSLPVPSVQEIVKNDSWRVPDRYIQEYKNRPVDQSEFYPASFEIPVINFSLLLNGDEDELRKLNAACKRWGFFQITNHGVAESVLNDMKATVEAFFELSLDEKKKYAMVENDLQGYGQGYVVSEQQKLNWGDLFFLMTLPSIIRKLKLWPLTIPGFKEAVEQFSTEIHKLTKAIFANLSLLMGMDEDRLKVLHGEMKQAIRMNYYPTCSRPDPVLGVSPHSDGSSITSAR